MGAVRRTAAGCLVLLASGAALRAATLESRLGTSFGITANAGTDGADPVVTARSVASGDMALPLWSELHSAPMMAALVARANQDRALGLKVLFGFSPTSINGLRTEIDLPPWVAAGCGVSTATVSFSNPCVKNYFIADATTVAAALQPDYFHVATEINTLILRQVAQPADLEYVHFGQLYQQVYSAIKAVRPACQVFVSFQYELQLRFERDNPGVWNSLLDVYRGPGVSKLDVVGYTSYPCQNGFGDSKFAQAWQIPGNYYAPAAAHLTGAERTFFSEVGWPSRGSGTESSQRGFVERLPELMAPARPVFVVWTLLHDVPSAVFSGNVDLASVGVRAEDGSPKPAWEVLTGSVAGDPFRNTRAYPSPFKPGASPWVLTGLPPNLPFKIYDLTGRAVVSLTTNDFGGAQWDGRDGGGRLLESGLYFVLLRSDGRTKKIRLVLQR